MLRHLLLLLLSPAPLVAQALAPLPVEAVRTGALGDTGLRESSGVARSRTMPGVLFTINDSGNPPVVFATDTSGRVTGRWLVPGVRNRDWEAIAVGPCPAGSCLYIGDIGDNLERAATVTIYRVPEPTRLAQFEGGAAATPPGLDSIRFRYPDRAHDAEAMWVAADGGIHIVTKGRSGEIRLYRVDPARSPVAAREARLLQVLPLAPDQSIGRWVTDGALSPDGRTVALRTYTELYLFPVLAGGRLGTPRACNVAGLEPQGEGIDWLDARRLVLTSEAGFGWREGPIHVVTCGA